MKYTKLIYAAAMLLIAFAGFSCQQAEEIEEMVPEKFETVPGKAGPEITEAVAVLHPTEDNSAHGVVRFIKVENGIKITADVQGLTPGMHGFHIHEYGDCSAMDGTSAGGHFDPEDMPHGGPENMERHVGDLGNLEADEEGFAHYERIDEHLAFAGPHSIIGRGVIVHAAEDDLTSQPTGAAGPRVCCGVIGVANPQK